MDYEEDGELKNYNEYEKADIGGHHPLREHYFMHVEVNFVNRGLTVEGMSNHLFIQWFVASCTIV